MQVKLIVDEGVYPVNIKVIVNEDASVVYSSELVGSTISSFASHGRYEGATMEESIAAIAKELRRALAELMEH